MCNMQYIIIPFLHACHADDVKNRWFSTCRKKKDQESSLVSCYIAMIDASSADLSYKRARAHCFNKAIVAWLRLYEGTERTEPGGVAGICCKANPNSFILVRIPAVNRQVSILLPYANSKLRSNFVCFSVLLLCSVLHCAARACGLGS